MAGCLYVVATPIGNLEDITLRALRVLREANLIAAEDTRRTAKLLQHYSIATPTTSLHEHNERQKLPMLLDRLLRGDRVALVSDAGTPTVSDPGARLVAAALDAGIAVDPIPGPSAILATLAASGFQADSFTFAGFPPTRANDRRAWFEKILSEQGLAVFFEAPHRILRTLTELAPQLGDRPIVVARELTKMHQEVVRGSTQAVLERLGSPRGEYTVAILRGPKTPETPHRVDPERLLAEFCHMTDSSNLTRRQIVVALSKAHQTSTREVYRMLELAKSGRSDDQ